MSTIRCYIGLGSNLADPIKQVNDAIIELGQLDNCTLTAQSSLYRSDPMGPQDQPDFINAAAELETELEAEALLDQLQSLEQLHQRIREQHWGPRTLDLDLLTYGDEVISSQRLSVPHPFMNERSFVLYPLAEIAPDLIIPQMGSLHSLLSACPMGTLTKIRV